MLVRIEVLEGTAKVVSDKGGHQYIATGQGAVTLKTRYLAMADDSLVQSGDVTPASSDLSKEDARVRKELGLPPVSEGKKNPSGVEGSEAPVEGDQQQLNDPQYGGGNGEGEQR